MSKKKRKKKEAPDFSETYTLAGIIVILVTGVLIHEHYKLKAVEECGVITIAHVKKKGYNKGVKYYYYYYDHNNNKHESSKRGCSKEKTKPKVGGKIYIMYPCNDPSWSAFVPIGKKCSLASDSLLVRAYAKEHNLHLLE
ncbi:hypothetical protein KMW28_02480 [Flammeovirga yaeyamensis]|uniref:NusG domain-containing protein n=1 Tax=Flammeovirga yaeyamensis TaxID=367791 RepID=A0AAX1N4M9_9BACT|nr:hypothetical protein [Flammeovirga yaeyamensis]MBB3700379.1 hypothetical protein [Flammeovirga yaeyamensis]NMF36995.1 hypothetical protein [Flammeovirga yaeyamensis]QWG02461.1 hypothetical protein KMW28_02480 [Flammeovirga yaeyamensis]